jgi:hypothetical protein
MGRIKHSVFGALMLSAVFALSGCFGPPAPAPPSTSAAPGTVPTPTGSSAAPTSTASPAPPATPGVTMGPTTSVPPSSMPVSPTTTAEPASPGLPEQVAPLTIYYIAIDDGGISGPLIGCGDSLVATTTAPVRFTDQVGPSIGALLANKNRDVGLSGLVNALYQSNLTYTGGQLDGSTITIHLEGQFMLGGVCDVPRVKAQLEYTAMTAAGATSARVLVNGRPIDEVLSLK